MVEAKGRDWVTVRTWEGPRGGAILVEALKEERVRHGIAQLSTIAKGVAEGGEAVG